MPPKPGTLHAVGDGHVAGPRNEGSLAVLRAKAADSAAGDAGDTLLAPQVLRELETSVAVLVEGFAPDGGHARLEALGRAIGAPSTHDVTNPESPFVHRVEPLSAPERDARGRLILSTTPRTFPCHSDEFFSSDPADLIFLQCVRPASCGGGRTLIAPARTITTQLSVRTLELMRAHRWPAPDEPAALLFGDAHDPCLRYHSAVLARAQMPWRQRIARRQLRAAVGRSTFELTLGAGDLLIVDNLRALHGRTSMQDDSGRLLLRMRVRRGP